MSVIKFIPPLRFVIAGADKKFSTALAGQISALSDRFSVEQLGQSRGDTEPAITALTNADLLVIATEGAGGFNSDHRALMKVASICGLGNFLLVIDSGEGHQWDPSTASQIKGELGEYIETLSQSGCGTVSGELLFLSAADTDQDGALKLQAYLSKLEEKINSTTQPFRMPVAGSPGGKLDEPSGEISSGEIHLGDKIVILPAARRASIISISQDDISVDEAHAGQTIGVKLSDGLVAAPGDMICAADAPVEAADQFETTIIWTSDEPMMSGRPYVVKSTTNTIDASITTIKYLVNVESDEHVAANRLEKNDIGVCNISLSSRIPFEPISTARQTGRFELFDMESGEPVGTGAIHFALRRASNVHWQALDVNRQTRATLKGQSPAILWFTGLSGSGKSAIANIVEKKLTAMGRHTYTLDGDNIRHGLNRDLGFTDVDRVENIRRIGEVSRLMADCGLITLVSFISPFRSERQLARELAEQGEFIEIYVDTPLEVAEKRDVKGLYKKARAGEIANFTGIDSPYEAPENPEIRVDTITTSAELAAEMILQKLDGWGMIKSI